MRQPRVDDFDPNAKAAKELKSSMDNFPAIEKQPAKPAEATPATPAQPVPPVRDVRPTPSTAVAGRRKIKSRHPFDIYEDQDEQLRELSLADRMNGGNGSMSAMVREAIDDFIAKKRGN